MTARTRCPWPGSDPLYLAYHDEEWGTPAHDDRHLFEMIVLEGAQAGLSWITILRKRERYRQVFDRFDPHIVASYGAAKVGALLADAGIVRNRMKIDAAIGNARAFLAVQEEFGSFDAYLWRFVEGQPKNNAWRAMREVPAKTAESDALSRDLRHMTVQTAEGPIGKLRGRSTGRSGRRSYLFDVGGGTFRVASRAWYDAAPDAGMVRVFFLPRSQRVVNLERLPDVAFAPGTTPQDVVASLGAAVRSHNRREVNEIRAKMAPAMDAMNASRDAPVTPPPLGARDPRPLAEAIVGTWRSAILNVTFDADGSVSTTMLGGIERRGHWSVDRAGRLVSDVLGREDAAEAWVVGGELTIAAEGTALKFTRD
jgi:DNA-3-methyladenine glycosylase I